jgi:hypothetical protein
MGYLRSLGDSTSCWSSIKDMFGGASTWPALKVPGVQFTARQADCVFNSSDGPVRQVIGKNYGPAEVEKYLSRFMGSLHPADRGGAAAAMRKWFSAQSANRQDKIRSAVDKVAGKAPAALATRMTMTKAPSAPAFNFGPGSAPSAPVFETQAAALDPELVDNMTRNAQAIANRNSGGGDDGVASTYHVGPSGMPARFQPAPMKVGGVPVMYLAIGGAALAGVFFLTRKKKGA